MKNVTLIVAVSENNGIGKNGKIPWYIPEDLKRFKKITSGHAVVMGRKTYESLPIKPLPNRKNIILTSRKTVTTVEGCSLARSLQEVKELVKAEDEIFIIGGSSVYSAFLSDTTKLLITKVYKTFDCDVFFPEVDFRKWSLRSKELHHQEELSYSFLDYRLKG